jgi:hypothetical protein
MESLPMRLMQDIASLTSPTEGDMSMETIERALESAAKVFLLFSGVQKRPEFNALYRANVGKINIKQLVDVVQKNNWESVKPLVKAVTKSTTRARAGTGADPTGHSRSEKIKNVGKGVLGGVVAMLGAQPIAEMGALPSLASNFPDWFLYGLSYLPGSNMLRTDEIDSQKAFAQYLHADASQKRVLFSVLLTVAGYKVLEKSYDVWKGNSLVRKQELQLYGNNRFLFAVSRILRELAQLALYVSAMLCIFYASVGEICDDQVLNKAAANFISGPEMMRHAGIEAIKDRSATIAGVGIGTVIKESLVNAITELDEQFKDKPHYTIVSGNNVLQKCLRNIGTASGDIQKIYELMQEDNPKKNQQEFLMAGPQKNDNTATKPDFAKKLMDMGIDLDFSSSESVKLTEQLGSMVAVDFMRSCIQIDSKTGVPYVDVPEQADPTITTKTNLKEIDMENKTSAMENIEFNFKNIANCIGNLKLEEVPLFAEEHFFGDVGYRDPRTYPTKGNVKEELHKQVVRIRTGLSNLFPDSSLITLMDSVKPYVTNDEKEAINWRDVKYWKDSMPPPPGDKFKGNLLGFISRKIVGGGVLLLINLFVLSVVKNRSRRTYKHQDNRHDVLVAAAELLPFLDADIGTIDAGLRFPGFVNSVVIGYNLATVVVLGNLLPIVNSATSAWSLSNTFDNNKRIDQLLTTLMATAKSTTRMQNTVSDDFQASSSVQTMLLSIAFLTGAQSYAHLYLNSKKRDRSWWFLTVSSIIGLAAPGLCLVMDPALAIAGERIKGDKKSKEKLVL